LRYVVGEGVEAGAERDAARGGGAEGVVVGGVDVGVGNPCSGTP